MLPFLSISFYLFFAPEMIYIVSGGGALNSAHSLLPLCIVIVIVIIIVTGEGESGFFSLQCYTQNVQRFYADLCARDVS